MKRIFFIFLLSLSLIHCGKVKKKQSHTKVSQKAYSFFVSGIDKNYKPILLEGALKKEGTFFKDTYQLDLASIKDVAATRNHIFIETDQSTILMHDSKKDTTISLKKKRGITLKKLINNPQGNDLYGLFKTVTNTEEFYSIKKIYSATSNHQLNYKVILTKKDLKKSKTVINDTLMKNVKRFLIFKNYFLLVTESGTPPDELFHIGSIQKGNVILENKEIDTLKITNTPNAISSIHPVLGTIFVRNHNSFLEYPKMISVEKNKINYKEIPYNYSPTSKAIYSNVFTFDPNGTLGLSAYRNTTNTAITSTSYILSTYRIQKNGIPQGTPIMKATAKFKNKKGENILDKINNLFIIQN